MTCTTRQLAPAPQPLLRCSPPLRACAAGMRLVVLLALVLRHACVGAYPTCNDPLAAAGAWCCRHVGAVAPPDAHSTGTPYVRPFAEPRDFGRPGLSHVTLHGAVHHGAREVRHIASFQHPSIRPSVMLDLRRWRSGSRRLRRKPALPSIDTTARRSSSCSPAAARCASVTDPAGPFASFASAQTARSWCSPTSYTRRAATCGELPCACVHV